MKNKNKELQSHRRKNNKPQKQQNMHINTKYTNKAIKRTRFLGHFKYLIGIIVIWTIVVLLEVIELSRFHYRHIEVDQTPQDERQKHHNVLPASIWTTRDLSLSQYGTTKNKNAINQTKILSLLTPEEENKTSYLCGKLYYSNFQNNAIQLLDHAQKTYVSTGDIDNMWIRDSVVQLSLYLNRDDNSYSNRWPFLRFIIEGAIRQNAFNILQDPYANAYNKEWIDPTKMKIQDRVIGRGGYIGTRNYELDSGAYFLTQLYDYYYHASSTTSSSTSSSHHNEHSTSATWYNAKALLEEPIIYEAVNLMVDTWIVEQRHDEQSSYRYLELQNEGKGKRTRYTGMTWSGFRPSDDKSQFGYSIPSNIFAAASLERMLLLNQWVWQRDDLEEKVTKLLREIEDGINKYGIVEAPHSTTKEQVYAYEVDGKGKVLVDFDDANIPSLLSIPLLGWTGYNRTVYRATRKRLLSSKYNQYYYKGPNLRGIGSPHTSRLYVWPMAMVVEGLTEEDNSEDDQEEQNQKAGAAATESTSKEHRMVFQLRQLLRSATNDVMHESVHVNATNRYTRKWFEWANVLFVIYVETILGYRCDLIGHTRQQALIVHDAIDEADPYYYSPPNKIKDNTNEVKRQGLHSRLSTNQFLSAQLNKIKNTTNEVKGQGTNMRVSSNQFLSAQLNKIKDNTNEVQKHGPNMRVYSNQYKNDPTNPLLFQGINAYIRHDYHHQKPNVAKRNTNAVEQQRQNKRASSNELHNDPTNPLLFQGIYAPDKRVSSNKIHNGPTTPLSSQGSNVPNKRVSSNQPHNDPTNPLSSQGINSPNKRVSSNQLHSGPTNPLFFQGTNVPYKRVSRNQLHSGSTNHGTNVPQKRVSSNQLRNDPTNPLSSQGINTPNKRVSSHQLFNGPTHPLSSQGNNVPNKRVSSNQHHNGLTNPLLFQGTNAPNTRVSSNQLHNGPTNPLSSQGINAFTRQSG